MNTSHPCFILPANAILDRADAPYEGARKIPPERVLTDGCGLMNQAAALRLFQCKSLELLALPSAVQVRIGGAKGMLVHSLDHPDPNPTVLIRKSQTKIHLECADIAQSTVEVVRLPRLTSPANLSADVCSVGLLTI